MTLSRDEESLARIALARMTDDQLRQELLILRNLVASLEARQVKSAARIAELEQAQTEWQMAQIDERRRWEAEQRAVLRQALDQVDAQNARIAQLEASADGLTLAALAERVEALAEEFARREVEAVHLRTRGRGALRIASTPDGGKA